jgi:hypothetical protein
VLLLCTPAGFERYFDRLAAEYAGFEPPEPSGPIPEARVVGPRIVADASEGAAADAGREDSAMTAQTGESRQRSAGRAIDCARGEALQAAEVGATQNAASPAPSCATVIPLADATTRTRAGATSTAALRRTTPRAGQARFGHSVRAMQAPTDGQTPRKQDYELEPTSVPRGAVLRTGD